MAALTKNDLRDYVQEGKRVTGDGYVLLDLKHNLTTRNFAEIQFHVDTDVEDVKFRIYSHTGTKPEFMQLILHGVTLEDGQKLGAYGPQSHDLLEVIDHDPDSVARNGGLDDVTQVQRYVMSDEDYDKRPESYRKWKADHLAKDPNWVAPWVRKELEAAQARRAELGPLEPLEEVEKRFKVGDRCEVNPGGRRGEIMYIGWAGRKPITNLDKTVDMPQVFIGVKFDEPVGKNDGTSKGVRYFECAAGYGSFVAPAYVKSGDYPYKDPFDSDNEEDKPADAADAENVDEEL